MSKEKKPKKWIDCYPQGCKEGDQEQKFFIAIARNPKYEWRSVHAISKETSLTVERVEEIIQKYHKKGMVFQNPKNEEHWGYWERVPQMLAGDNSSLTEADQNERIDKAVGCVDSKGTASKNRHSFPALHVREVVLPEEQTKFVKAMIAKRTASKMPTIHDAIKRVENLVSGVKKDQIDMSSEAEAALVKSMFSEINKEIAKQNRVEMKGEFRLPDISMRDGSLVEHWTIGGATPDKLYGESVGPIVNL